jgi:hypothetical protein
MRADVGRFREAVAAGKCRLEPGGGETDPPEALLEGNPA